MRVHAFQVTLSVLAGFVDAIGFGTLNGTYVAFMSGNSTLIGIGAAGGAADPIRVMGGLLVCFVLGVVVGTLIGGCMVRWRPVGVLLTSTALLVAGAALDQAELVVPGGMMLALAMGAVNTVFNRPGYSGVGLTYMTGTLVRIGQRLSETVSGGSWRAVLPDVLLWAGLVGGAGLGTLAFHHIGGTGLWAAAAGMFLLAALARLVLPAEIRGS